MLTLKTIKLLVLSFDFGSLNLDSKTIEHANLGKIFSLDSSIEQTKVFEFYFAKLENLERDN